MASAERCNRAENYNTPCVCCMWTVCLNRGGFLSPQSYRRGRLPLFLSYGLDRDFTCRWYPTLKVFTPMSLRTHLCYRRAFYMMYFCELFPRTIQAQHAYQLQATYRKGALQLNMSKWHRYAHARAWLSTLTLCSSNPPPYREPNLVPNRRRNSR